MKPEDKFLAVAHLWLFSAGLDPKAMDASGNPLAVSLGSLLEQSRNEGRKEAASHYVASRGSGEFSVNDIAESTGAYTFGQLDKLLEKIEDDQ